MIIKSQGPRNPITAQIDRLILSVIPIPTSVVEDGFRLSKAFLRLADSTTRMAAIAYVEYLADGGLVDDNFPSKTDVMIAAIPVEACGNPELAAAEMQNGAAGEMKAAKT